jgi:hypothetical protein
MANLHWDHTIHLVNDLDQAVEQFRQQRLHAVRGGSHKNWGTYNALSYFGLNYIEFLSIENRELAAQTEDYNVVARDPLTLLPEHEIFTRVVIRTDNLDETAERIASNGLKLSPITPGKRLNTQGRWIEWKMATVYGDYQGLKYPFFIEWKDSDEQRLSDNKASGVLQPHTIGDITTDYAVFTVPNPAETAAHWQKVFGLSTVVWENQDEAALAIGEHKFVFRTGNEPCISEIVFRASNPEAIGKHFTIGGGTYLFR